MYLVVQCDLQNSVDMTYLVYIFSQQVVYAANSYGREGLDTITNIGRQEGLCVVNSIELETPANASDVVNTVSQGTTKVVVLYLGTTLTSAFLQVSLCFYSSQKALCLCFTFFFFIYKLLFLPLHSQLHLWDFPFLVKLLRFWTFSYQTKDIISCSVFMA